MYSMSLFNIDKFTKKLGRTPLKAKDYFELSSKLNNPYAHFILANFYSTCDLYDIQKTKEIGY